MTFERLLDLIQKNNIPMYARLESNSGWECGPTEMDGVYYNKSENIIVFDQGIEANYCEPEWSLIWKEKSNKNINNPFYAEGGVQLLPIFKHDRFQNLFKEEIKNSHEFEQYYGVKESDEKYDKIDLDQPMFWGIYVRDSAKSIAGYIGYIGVTVGDSADEFDIEIYIFRDYRRQGYGKIALSTLVEYLRDGRVKVYARDTDEINPFIPKQIKVTVREDNKASRTLMESCGFVIPKSLVTIMYVSENEDEDDECMICVQYVYGMENELGD